MHACIPSLDDDNVVNVAGLLIYHAEWMRDRLARTQKDDLFSKVDYYVENEPHPASQECGAFNDVFDAVDACLPSLYANLGDVAALLISHAEWMCQRLARTQQEQGDAIEDDQ